MPSHFGQEDQTMGRSSIYSDELAAEICERLAAGESLNAICRDERMPSRKVIHEWVADDRNGFRDKYARAREMQADHYADKIAEIADETKRSTAPDRAQIGRLELDALKWSAAKLAPKKYGDRVETENTTTLNTADPLTALMQKIASSGTKIYDPRPK
jgi:hypothetical protein